MVDFTSCQATLFLPKTGPINQSKINYNPLKVEQRSKRRLKKHRKYGPMEAVRIEQK